MFLPSSLPSALLPSPTTVIRKNANILKNLVEFGTQLSLTILSKYLSEVNQLTNNIVVSTVMSNYGFKQAIEKFNFDLIETPVGDKYVAEAMKKYDAALGGEQSGHIIISDLLPVGDGLVTLIYVLKAMQHFGVALSDFKSENLYEYPQKLTNLELKNKLNDEELEYINQIALDMSIKKDLVHYLSCSHKITTNLCLL